MTTATEERITQHQSYITLQEIIGLLEKIEYNDLPDKLQIPSLERINETLTFLKDSLDRVYPSLVSINTLNNLQSHLSNIRSYINSYISNHNQGGYLNNAISQIEGLLPYLPQLNIIRTSDDIESIRNTTISFKKSIGQHLSHLEKEATETKTALSKSAEKVQELADAVDKQKTRVDTVISDFHNQFLSAQTSRNNEFNNFIKSSEEKNQETFEELVTKQEDIFSELNDKYTQNIDDQEKSFIDLVENFKSEIQTQLDEIKDMNKQAEKILGTMGVKALAQGYQRIANLESKKATLWNSISIISIIGVLCFGYEFIIKHSGELSWQSTISRLVLTGVGVTLFTYCAKQATNHRNEETRNRKIELELASLDPYLKDFEPDKQKEVKHTLVDKYFGVDITNATSQQDLSPSQQKAISSLMSNPEFIKTLTETVKPFVTK
ncbi:hypothetical protein [Bacillus inaquosorum]|uniref:hypothetical protein n=1 Tax=Bacillus inaquosorum TaxID=483913 RepID=UPI0022811E52|nr:hypothetical protein [Bacillus inaquosorum]MCY8493184.1 hypothetical protein [Bacillus inaquosorum]